MRLYLDEDSASSLLVQLLRSAGHDVQTPTEAGMIGEETRWRRPGPLTRIRPLLRRSP
jgi:hypothetical protein